MVSALYGLSLHAQDIRHADFPACLILTAHLAAPGGALAEADERNTDTARIQADGGVALFASRNPRDYDLTPDKLPRGQQRGYGCKNFITADNAKSGGIMGDGAIDGHGGGAQTLRSKRLLVGPRQNRQDYDLSQGCRS